MIEKILQLCPKMEDYLDGIITSGEYTNLTENNFLKIISNDTLVFSSANGFNQMGTYTYNGVTYDKFIMIGANASDNNAIATTHNLSSSISNREKCIFAPTAFNGNRPGKINSDDIFITRLVMNIGVE